MDTRKILHVTFFVVFNLSALLLRAFPKKARFYRTSKVLRTVAICGMVIGGAGFTWNLLRGDPFEPQGEELAKRAAAEVGANPTHAQAEEWLKKNGFKSTGWGRGCPRSGNQRLTYSCVTGCKTLAKVTPDADGTSVQIYFFWEGPNGRFFGVEHDISPLYWMERPREKGAAVPAVMPNAAP